MTRFKPSITVLFMTTTTSSPYEVSARIAKAFRLVEILTKLGIESGDELDHWSEDQWFRLATADAKLNGLKKVRAPSDQTRAAVKAMMSATVDASDPFEGLL